MIGTYYCLQTVWEEKDGDLRAAVDVAEYFDGTGCYSALVEKKQQIHVTQALRQFDVEHLDDYGIQKYETCMLRMTSTYRSNILDVIQDSIHSAFAELLLKLLSVVYVNLFIYVLTYLFVYVRRR